MEFLLRIQQQIRDVLLAEFARYAAAPDISILIWLVPLGVVFGAAHALTPGHSKMVLASYVLGSRLSVLRSLGVSLVLAFVHVASAVVVALAATMLVKRTLAGAGRAPSLEFVSGGLLAVLGLWLLWRGLRSRPHVHHEGFLIGAAAGLIPCPLTLFTMFLAESRGIPEVGIAFAVMMMFGVALTLSLVAAATVFARTALVALLDKHANGAARILAALDVFTGLLLIAAGVIRAS